MPVYTLGDLHRLQQENLRLEMNILPELPQTPTMLLATGLKLSNRVNWSQAPGVDGYRIAAMASTSLNLAAPQKLYTVTGDSTLEFVETVGDVATLRYYSVQSFKKSVTGETLYSEWRYPLVSATSIVDGGAAGSAPLALPSAPITPEGQGTPGDPGGVVPTGGGGPVSE